MSGGFLDFVVKESYLIWILCPQSSQKRDIIEVSRPFGFFNMAASGHFGFLALLKFAQISQTLGAFVCDKYPKVPKSTIKLY